MGLVCCGTSGYGVVPASTVWYQRLRCGTTNWYGHYGVVPVGIVRYNMHGVVPSGMVSYHRVWCGTIGYGVVPSCMVWYNRVWCDSSVYGAVQSLR